MGLAGICIDAHRNGCRVAVQVDLTTLKIVHEILPGNLPGNAMIYDLPSSMEKGEDTTRFRARERQ